MSKKNDDFFVKKKAWSNVKDALLACYLKPYFDIIVTTGKQTIYVDCFAGKGRFDDGQDGSPLIAAKIIQKHIIDGKSIKSFFIDVNYADELKKNLCSYSDITVVSGAYEANIEEILKDKQGCNIFLYMDPYGIKSLKYSKQSGCLKGKFYSVELLINFNSFGFIREACRAMGCLFREKGILDDLEEYDSSFDDLSSSKIEDLNEVAGGDYWQDIIKKYNDDTIDGYQAEEELSVKYCERLRRDYKYVLNMPIRMNDASHPKYRLIHVTNHTKGCLLMVDNICGRRELLRVVQEHGQTQLFSRELDNRQVCDEVLSELIMSYFIGKKNDIHLTDMLTDFYMLNGPICETSVVKKKLKDFETNGRILIYRQPDTTPTGKKSSFMDEKNNHKVMLRWIK